MFKRFFKSRGNNATANVDPGGDSPDRKENPTTEILTSTKISPEKMEFALEFVDTLATLETSLHTSDDPEEISRGAMKMACDFYQADWCGFLMVDLDLGLWTPYCWYNTNSQDRTEMLTSEYESATKLPRWITAMQDNTKVMLRDVNAIKDEAPEEYEVYARLKIQSVLAVPVKPRPVGFLAVRNPKRFGDDERMLRMLAYVVLNAINQHSYFESAKMTLTPEGIQSDKDIVFNLFGELEIYTSKGVLREPDCNAPKCCRVIAYLMLNRRSTHPPLEIAATLWPEDQISSPETVSGNIRGLIYRFRQAFSLISDYPLIESTPSGYRINPELSITTDYQHFDRLWDAVQTATGVLQKTDLIKQALSIYKGNLFEDAAGEHWIMPMANSYNLRYIGLVNQLLSMLAEAGDYDSVQRYANESLEIAPGNVRAYYWLVHAMYRSGAVEMVKSEVARAKSILTAEEYKTLVEYLQEDFGTNPASTFSS